MGWNPFKKNVTVTGGGSEALVQDVDVGKTLADAKKDAVKKWIFDGSGLSYEERPALHEYLIAVGQGGMYKAWERAYHWALSGKYHHVGLPYEYEVSYRGEYYPTIPLKIHQDNQAVDVIANPTTAGAKLVKPSIENLCKQLGLNAKDLRDQIYQSIGEEHWNKMISVTLHLSSGLHQDNVVEPKGLYGTCAYNYLFIGLYSNNRERTTYFDTSGGKFFALGASLHSIRDSLTSQRTAFSGASGFSLIYTGGVIQGDPYDFSTGNNFLYDPAKAPYRDYNDLSKGRLSEAEFYARQWQYIPEHVRNMPAKSFASHYHKFTTNIFGGEMLTEYVRYFYRISSTNSPADFRYREVYIVNETGHMQDKHNTAEAGAWIVPNHYTTINRDENTEGSLFPLNRQILERFQPLERERIVQESLRVSWLYQTQQKVYRGFVRNLVKYGVIFVQIFATNYSFGAGGNISNNVLVKLGLQRATTYTLNKLIDVSVKLGWISVEVAQVLKLVINLVVAVKGSGWDFSKILAAPNIMKAVNASFEYMNKRNEWEIQELQKKAEEHQKYHNDRMAALQAKQKMADLGVATDPSLYLDMPSFAPTVDLFETPEMMYARHYNFNVVGISQGLVSNLADGLRYRQVDRVKQVKDVTQEIEDVLLIT